MKRACSLDDRESCGGVIGSKRRWCDPWNGSSDDRLEAMTVVGHDTMLVGGVAGRHRVELSTMAEYSQSGFEHIGRSEFEQT